MEAKAGSCSKSSSSNNHKKASNRRRRFLQPRNGTTSTLVDDNNEDQQNHPLTIFMQRLIRETESALDGEGSGGDGRSSNYQLLTDTALTHCPVPPPAQTQTQAQASCQSFSSATPLPLPRLYRSVSCTYLNSDNGALRWGDSSLVAGTSLRSSATSLLFGEESRTGTGTTSSAAGKAETFRPQQMMIRPRLQRLSSVDNIPTAPVRSPPSPYDRSRPTTPPPTTASTIDRDDRKPRARSVPSFGGPIMPRRRRSYDASSSPYSAHGELSLSAAALQIMADVDLDDDSSSESSSSASSSVLSAPSNKEMDDNNDNNATVPNDEVRPPTPPRPNNILLSPQRRSAAFLHGYSNRTNDSSNHPESEATASSSSSLSPSGRSSSEETKEGDRFLYPNRSPRFSTTRRNKPRKYTSRAA